MELPVVQRTLVVFTAVEEADNQTTVKIHRDVTVVVVLLGLYGDQIELFRQQTQLIYNINY
jgi:hypothetical protein